jgi:hypothetical protein
MRCRLFAASIRIRSLKTCSSDFSLDGRRASIGDVMECLGVVPSVVTVPSVNARVRFQLGAGSGGSSSALRARTPVSVWFRRVSPRSVEGSSDLGVEQAVEDRLRGPQARRIVSR